MEIFKDIIVSIAAIITSVVAIKGLYEWKEQMKGRDSYSIAKKILKYSYEFEDTIRSIRSPFISYAELTQRKKDNPDKSGYGTEQEERIRDEAYAYFQRFTKLQPCTLNLRLVKYEANAMWGKNKVGCVDNLIKKEKDLYIAYKMYFEHKLQWPHKDTDFDKKMYQKLYDMGDEDGFANDIQNSLRQIEEMMKEYIK